jgi:2-C-methyl-D-erythritol 4-phosphate cytidylyltransferase
MQKEKCTAIVLSAGQGKRMGTKIQKQYLEVDGRPILYFSLKVFQESPIIDEIIVVVGEGQKKFVQEEIIERYGLNKVRHIVTGGAQRYHSVWNGLQLIKEGYVFIHDGARPFIDEPIIKRAYESVCVHKACVISMPVKDTIKMVDEQGFVTSTPDRNHVWLMQTPQVFECELVKSAYASLMKSKIANVTDDAMVVELMSGHPIKLVEGHYQNIKITTPEDLEIAKLFAKRKY